MLSCILREAVQLFFFYQWKTSNNKYSKEINRKTGLANTTGNNEKLTLFVKELNCCYFKALQAIQCTYQKKANKGISKQVMPSSFP